MRRRRIGERNARNQPFAGLCGSKWGEEEEEEAASDQLPAAGFIFEADQAMWSFVFECFSLVL